MAGFRIPNQLQPRYSLDDTDSYGLPGFQARPLPPRLDGDFDD
jgi:hypothetical protein